MSRALLRPLMVALVLSLGLSGVASAQDWKELVSRAGGFWATNKDAPGWQALFAPEPARAVAGLPAGVQTMLRTEVEDNPWIAGHEEMQAKLGKFRPEAQQVFDLPYIPMPADKMKFGYEADNMSQNMRDNVIFTAPDGTRMIRFFFHPLYADKYKELIETYGVKYGEYQAISTSSPRSLVVWRKTAPSKPIWVKVSLHADLDYYIRREANGTETKVGISRVQSEKKARRSALVNAAFASAPREELARHKVDYMGEPASFVPGDIQYKAPGSSTARRVGFDRATIFRDLPESLTDLSATTRYVPAFTFIKNMKGTLETLNTERAAQGQKPINVIGWMTKGLIEPLIRTYLYLGLEHGLQGELHTQNFLLEVDAKGVPTGKVMVKDLDGFRMDLDMRVRNGRSLDYLKDYKHPFEWAKHSATQGSTASPAVLQGWFNKLIRNVNGFTTTRTVNGVTETVYATPSGQLMVQLERDFPEVMDKLKAAAVRREPSLAGNAEKTKQKAVEQIFDLVGRAQFNRITGIRIDMANWGFGQDKGLNNGLNTLRTELFRGQRGLGTTVHADGRVEANADAQRVLGGMFSRLRTAAERRADDRSWINGTPQTYRLIGDNVIEAISRGGKSVGYAILKPADVTRLQGELNAARLQVTPRVRVNGKLADYSARDHSGKAPFDAYFRPRR